MAKKIEDVLKIDVPTGLDGNELFQHFVMKERAKPRFTIYNFCVECVDCADGGDGGAGGPLENGKAYKLP